MNKVRLYNCFAFASILSYNRQATYQQGGSFATSSLFRDNYMYNNKKYAFFLEEL